MNSYISRKTYSLYYRWRLLYDLIYRNVVQPPYVMTIQETLQKIITDKCSLCRYGDGEISSIYGANLNFQPHNDTLSTRLKEILKSNTQDVLICLPRVFDSKWLNEDNPVERSFWKNHLLMARHKWYHLLSSNVKYGNALCSRFYSIDFDYDKSKEIYTLWAQIWYKRDLVIIEGQDSKLGVGNNCFDGSTSIKRIIAPSKNSFVRYNEILNTALHQDPNALYLIALGPTATVLAYDLAISGRQALDIGHIDLEYEWWTQRTTTKTTIPGKLCNATFLTGRQKTDVEGEVPSKALSLYKSEIITIID